MTTDSEFTQEVQAILHYSLALLLYGCITSPVGSRDHEIAMKYIEARTNGVINLVEEITAGGLSDYLSEDDTQTVTGFLNAILEQVRVNGHSFRLLHADARSG